MEILNSIYAKTVAQNDHNINFWEGYLNSLIAINFDLFSDKLSVPVMVPVGSRILFRGALKHTNEVMISLGADYFAKCSLKQAEILRQHRIKDAQSKLELFKKERQYIEKQMSFNKNNVYDTMGQEIIEEYSEEQDMLWREKHKENLKQYKLQSKHVQTKDKVNDEELWNRLEELELQEELENELALMDGKNVEPVRVQLPSLVSEEILNNVDSKNTETSLKQERKSIVKETETDSKLDLLQKVLDKQNELEEKLQAIKQKETSASKTEQDLMSRLDELEQLEELEDEMDRLDDIIQSEDVDYTNEEHTQEESTFNIKRSVSFADEDNSETLEITFKHSEFEASTEPYNPEIGIQKPSDIYEAHKNLISERTLSILKKPKYKPEPVNLNITEQENVLDEQNTVVNKTIVIKDVIEKEDRNSNTSESSGKRPTSLFKKKRMLNKV